MGVIAAIQERPRATIGVLVAIIAVAIVMAFASAKKEHHNVDVPSGAWFTTDDGKTLFTEHAGKLPPFDHDGKPAYRAYVYTCDGGQTRFVAFLERYTPDARRTLEEQRQSKMPPELGVIDRLMTQGREVKRPGEATWVNSADPKAKSIRKPVCPGAPDKAPQAVLP
jgi:hypothetical protein